MGECPAAHGVTDESIELSGSQFPLGTSGHPQEWHPGAEPAASSGFGAAAAMRDLTAALHEESSHSTSRCGAHRAKQPGPRSRNRQDVAESSLHSSVSPVRISDSY